MSILDKIGIVYFKAEPTEYVRISVGGKVKGEGRGQSGFFLEHRTSFELVDTSLVDNPFAFKETTADNQEISLQGGFTYVVEDPQKVLKTYNCTVNPHQKSYLTEGFDKLPEHILEVARAGTRKIVQTTPLEKILTMCDEISKTVAEETTKSTKITNLGVTVQSLYFAAISPQPEIAKALGAVYREGLLQKSDEASYLRRAMAVEKERAIRENELANQISLEKKREKFVALQGANTLQEADFRAQAEAKTLAVYKQSSPDELRALALMQLARDAKRIESLSITPELLGALNSHIKSGSGA